jgi:hypothetical protein
VPALGQGLDPDDTATALDQQAALAHLGIFHLICHHDPRRGHDHESLSRQLAVAKAMNAEPWLEAVVVSVNDFAREIAALGDMAAGLGSPFETVLVSPAPDMKGTLPGSTSPATPPAADLYIATRAAFPGKRIGGGMFSYFTELNRKRPPVDGLDLVSFTTSPLVHAGDDRSVTETIQALPAIVKSVAAISGAKPYTVGPSAIGVRDNPYGAAGKLNPGNVRQAMNWNDPRQRGLLGAAWTLAYFSRFAYGGASAIALGAPTGAFGVVAAPATFPQPWYDQTGGVYPLYHVLKGLAALRGRHVVHLAFSRPDLIQGLAVETDEGQEIWLANLGAEPVTIDLNVSVAAMACLDAESFVAAAQNPDHLDNLRPITGGAIILDSYAVLRLSSTQIH